MNKTRNLVIILLIIALALSIVLTIRNYRDYNWFESMGFQSIGNLSFTKAKMLISLMVTILVVLMTIISLLSYLKGKPYTTKLMLLLMVMTLIMIFANPGGNKWTGNIFLDLFGLSSRTIAIISGIFLLSGSFTALITLKKNKKD